MSWKKPTAGIILAAGISSRLGQPKQLLKLAEKCLVEWVLDASLKSRLESIYLVIGHKHEVLLETLGQKINHSRVHVLINRKYKEGQSGSLKIGITEITNTFSSVMILLGDQPLVDSKIIDHLLDRFWSSEKNICVPICRGKRNNPVIFSRKYYNQLQHIKGDIGGRQIIDDNPDQVLAVQMTNSFCFLDIDTKEDFADIQSLID